MNDVFEQIFPGLMLMFVCFIASGVFSDIFAEYRSNTIARLVTSGVTVRQVLVSKVLRCLVILLASELLLILFTSIVFQMNWWHRPLMLLAVLISFNLFVTGMMAFINGYARTSDLANAIITVVIIFSSMIAGIFISFDQLPGVIQTIGQWSMIRLGKQGIDALFASLPLWEAVRPSLYLSGAGLLLVWAGTRILNRRIRTGRIK